jgi:hypothetical protein
LAKFSAMPSGRQQSAQLVEFFDDSCRAFAGDCVDVLNVLSEELTACRGGNVVCDQDDGLRTAREPAPRRASLSCRSSSARVSCSGQTRSKQTNTIREQGGRLCS